MGVLLSTNMYNFGSLKRVLKYIDLFKGEIGIELFPLFHKAGYEEELLSCIGAFEEIPVSFHSPYYRSEYSAAAGSEAYAETMRYVEKTLEYCRRLKGKYLVFHHNNCRVNEEHKMEMIKNSCENFREIEGRYAKYNIPVFVENAGVIDRGNMLFNEKEFVDLCKRENYRVLVDIGHAHANGWNLTYVIEALKDHIEAYHIHNNDGIHDDHKRIMDGTLDFEKFAEDYKKFTPDAEIVVEYSMDVADDEEGIQRDIEFILKTFTKKDTDNCR